MIKISNHPLLLNSNKDINYLNFYEEYQELIYWFIDNIWNDLKYTNKKQGWNWNTKNKCFKLGKYYPNLKELILPINLNHWSARIIKSAATQAMGIIKSVLKKYNHHFNNQYK